MINIDEQYDERDERGQRENSVHHSFHVARFPPRHHRVFWDHGKRNKMGKKKKRNASRKKKQNSKKSVCVCVARCRFHKEEKKIGFKTSVFASDRLPLSRKKKHE